MAYSDTDIRGILESRKKAFEDAKAILDANPNGLTPEARSAYEKATAEVDRLKGEVEAREKLNAVERDLEATLGRKTGAAAVETQKLGEAVVQEFRKFVRGEAGNDFDSKIIEPHFAEKRALSVGTTDAGGYSVQNERMGNLHEFLKWFGTVRPYANVIQTSTGASLPIPTVTDTANSAALTSEAGAVASNVDPTYGQVTLSSYKYVSPIVLVSMELERDSSFDITAYLTRALGVRLARKENNAFTVGTGSSQPQGFVVGSAAGKTAAATNAITFDEIIDLMHSVDKAYRDGAAFFAHDSIIAAIRKLKDGNLRYIWEPSTQVGAPDTLFGKPLIANNDMQSSLATGTKTLVFGNLKEGFIVRDIGSPGFMRTTDRYIETLQTGFLAYAFHDSKVVDSTAVKHLIQA